MESGHCWDSGFGKSALLSLLYSVSVLNGHGHLFSYRTYYAINSLVWEGEKCKSSQIHCVCNLFCCPAHSSAATAHSWTGQCCHPQTLLRPFQVLSNPRSSHELCLAGLLFFLPVSFAELGSNVVAWCDWTDRQTPSAPGRCGSKSGQGSPEPTHLPWLFQELIKNTCGGAVNQTWNTPVSQQNPSNDRSARQAKTKGFSKTRLSQSESRTATPSISTAW